MSVQQIRILAPQGMSTHKPTHSNQLWYLNSNSAMEAHRVFLYLLAAGLLIGNATLALLHSPFTPPAIKTEFANMSDIAFFSWPYLRAGVHLPPKPAGSCFSSAMCINAGSNIQSLLLTPLTSSQRRFNLTAHLNSHHTSLHLPSRLTPACLQL